MKSRVNRESRLRFEELSSVDNLEENSSSNKCWQTSQRALAGEMGSHHVSHECPHENKAVA